MELYVLPQTFAVCKLQSFSPELSEKEFCFLAKTDEECSLVCPEKDAPDRTLAREDGWRGFRICGTLDFSLIGILAGITAALAEARVGVFVISTYNTDYILVKQNNFSAAAEALSAAGYTLLPPKQ